MTEKTTETETPETEVAVKTVVEQVSVLAEKAVTVPIGAGLVVRDDLTSAFRKLHKKYGTSAGLEKELTRFEKRGTRARNRFEKQVRTQRTKFEREMRQRRKAFDKQSTAVQARVEEIVSAAQGLIS
jgi:prefoldin subunit 5